MVVPHASLTEDTTEAEALGMLEQINSGGAGGGLANRMGIEFTGIGFDWMTATVPVEGNTQPMGLFHGGGHVVLAESLASMHSFLTNATHLRATRGGIVTGRAEVLHRGRTLLSHEVRMTDEEDRLLSIVRITNMVLASKA